MAANFLHSFVIIHDKINGNITATRANRFLDPAPKEWLKDEQGSTIFSSLEAAKAACERKG